MVSTNETLHYYYANDLVDSNLTYILQVKHSDYFGRLECLQRSVGR